MVGSLPIPISILFPFVLKKYSKQPNSICKFYFTSLAFSLISSSIFFSLFLSSFSSFWSTGVENISLIIFLFLCFFLLALKSTDGKLSSRTELAMTSTRFSMSVTGIRLEGFAFILNKLASINLHLTLLQ